MSFWKNPGKRIILASASPRRKQILEQMGLNFDVIVPKSFNESEHLDPDNLEKSIQNLASKKADLVAQVYPESLVLGADTVVVNGSVPLGKPADRDDAFAILKGLSGKTHKVMTGTSLICKESGFEKTAVTVTDVVFRPINDQEILDYLAINEYCDKAGAYAIQGKALVFIDSINGCYYNVVGLPVTSTIELFKAFVDRKECIDV